MTNIQDFNWVVYNRDFDRLVHNQQGRDLFIVDTGAIIDLDAEYAKVGMNNGHVHPGKLLDMISMEHPLIITPGILKEVRRHRLCRIGHRSEITEGTGVLVERLARESQGILQDAKAVRDYDFHKYAVYMAGRAAFANDYRKGEKDVISDVDVDNLTLALVLSRMQYEGEPVGCVNILTPDEHLEGTLACLKTCNGFINYNVRVLHTRKDTKCYRKK